MNTVGDGFEGRCMKCKQTQHFTSIEIATMKTGSKMAKGPCDVCQTTVCRILPKEKV